MRTWALPKRKLSTVLVPPKITRTNISTARKIAQHLNIDVGEDTLFNNSHIEWPINNWLHDNEKLHTQAAFIKWHLKDGEYGISFISRFRQVNDPAPDDFIKREKDLGVRKWLMNIMMDAGGIQCQWVSILDRYGITCVKFGHSTEEKILNRIQVAKMQRGRGVDKV